MTNGEKYKTAEERDNAYGKYLDNLGYGCVAIGKFYWLDLEAEEEKPMPCPFCGTVSANYESVIAAKDRIIAGKDAEIDSLKRTLRTAARWIATHDIYGHMGSAILEDAKKLLDDDGRFLG